MLWILSDWQYLPSSITDWWDPEHLMIDYWKIETERCTLIFYCFLQVKKDVSVLVCAKSRYSKNMLVHKLLLPNPNGQYFAFKQSWKTCKLPVTTGNRWPMETDKA